MAINIAWNKQYDIGIDSIDKAHAKLFSIVGRLFSLAENPKNNKRACIEGVKYFKSYAVKHFSDEEAYMRSVKYKDYNIHKAKHDLLREKTIPALETELELSDYSDEAVQHFLGFCIGWLTGHIMVDDRAITGEFNKDNFDKNFKPNIPLEPSKPSVKKGAMGEEEISMMEKAISLLMYEVFDIEVQILNRNYAGGYLGKSICYRLNYRIKGGGKIKIVLVLEERLLLKTVGRMMDIKFSKINDILISAAMQISEQLTRYIGRYLKYDYDEFELEKEAILTQEQFIKGFVANYFDYNVLYDASFGRFAFCVKKLT